MSTAEDNDPDNNNNKNSNSNADDLERKVGGAEIPPPTILVPPQSPANPQPCPPVERATRSPDRRLNPNAPVFVPQFKAELLAVKLYQSLAPYTRWSSDSMEDTSYGPRLDSIWREISVEQLRPNVPHFDGDPYEEMVDLELDEHQAMNIGAESYDPKLSRSANNPMVHTGGVEVPNLLGDVQPQLEVSQGQTSAEEQNDSGKDIRPRHPKPGRRCCIIM